jgi:hypothetical protein
MQRARAAQEAAAAAVRNGSGTLLLKHVHKVSTLTDKKVQCDAGLGLITAMHRPTSPPGPAPAPAPALHLQAGGSTLCRLAQQNMAAEVANLPNRKDWNTNCVPYEAFLGPHPAAAASSSGRAARSLKQNAAAAAADGGLGWHQPAIASGNPVCSRRHLQGLWLGGACWLGFLTPAQLRALPQHFRPLTFVASEGPLPDTLPLDAQFALVTMLRRPLDRVLSSYRWWQVMLERMPQAPGGCC